MPLDYDLIKNWQFKELRQHYGERDAILYALSIGLGADPLDPQQLQYVYEDGLRVFPSMAAVLGYPGFWMKDPRSGISWTQVVHGEQRIHYHAPFPSKGEVIAQNKITHVIDKGADKGALVVTERTIQNALDKTLLATLQQVTFCRADGGFGRSDSPLEPLPAVPNIPADSYCELPTPLQSALLYRLNGDLNPLHADPAVAASAGFSRPILHGLCTYAYASQALVRTLCDGDAARLAYLHGRFSAPVLSGETLQIEFWHSQSDYVQFQVRVKERDTIVLSHGVAGLRPA